MPPAPDGERAESELRDGAGRAVVTFRRLEAQGDRTMKATAAVLIVLLSAGFALAAADQPVTQEQALAALADKHSVESRRLGAAHLGETGQMQDVPLLIEALRDPDVLVTGLADQSLWKIWARSGDPDVDVVFQHGVDQMNQQDFSEAIETFSQIIQKKPDFAEAWNKRATIYFLIGEYQKSLADCEEVLRRNPVHFGVLSGFGLNYIGAAPPAPQLCKTHLPAFTCFDRYSASWWDGESITLFDHTLPRVPPSCGCRFEPWPCAPVLQSAGSSLTQDRPIW